MDITLKEISVKELSEGFVDSEETGVIGFSGKLNIRPKYQREFIYGDVQRKSVIDSILKGFPLNVMYWSVNKDNSFEVIDGQQRTISICQFINNGFSIENRYFKNLSEDEQEKILNYRIMVYFCKGTESEKLDWFKTINISGEKLTEQELRNAVYSGSWLDDAKRYFSKNNCSAYNLASDYMQGTPIRQDYLETVIDWVSGSNIEDYMAINQHETNASDIWLYFQSVINWVKTSFPVYRKEMKSVQWGKLYNEFGKIKIDGKEIEATISKLMQDDDVTNKKGIYSYVLSKNEKFLNIRSFTNNQKREAFEKQKGVCPKCGKTFKIEQMEADHITPWHEGGKTVSENCQMLCKEDNRRKSGK